MPSYKQYPRKSLLTDWKTLLKMSKEEVLEIENEWNKIEEENAQTMKDNQQLREQELAEIEAFMVQKGIPVRKVNKAGKETVYLPWFKNNVFRVIESAHPHFAPQFPSAGFDKQEIDGVMLYSNKQPVILHELHDTLTHQLEDGKKEVAKKNKLYQASVDYAKENGLNIVGLDVKKLIEVVNEHAVDAYLAKEVPPGTTVHLSGECDECDTYTQGEYRCDCGNTRISVTVDGDLIEGYYYYPELF